MKHIAEFYDSPVYFAEQASFVPADLQTLDLSPRPILVLVDEVEARVFQFLDGAKGAVEQWETTEKQPWLCLERKKFDDVLKVEQKYRNGIISHYFRFPYSQ